MESCRRWLEHRFVVTLLHRFEVAFLAMQMNDMKTNAREICKYEAIKRSTRDNVTLSQTWLKLGSEENCNSKMIGHSMATTYYTKMVLTVAGEGSDLTKLL